MSQRFVQKRGLGGRNGGSFNVLERVESGSHKAVLLHEPNWLVRGAQAMSWRWWLQGRTVAGFEWSNYL